MNLKEAYIQYIKKIGEEYLAEPTFDNIKRLAVKYEVSQRTIYKWLKRLGIETTGQKYNKKSSIDK